MKRPHLHHLRRRKVRGVDEKKIFMVVVTRGCSLPFLSLHFVCARSPRSNNRVLVGFDNSSK